MGAHHSQKVGATSGTASLCAAIDPELMRGFVLVAGFCGARTKDEWRVFTQKAARWLALMSAFLWTKGEEIGCIVQRIFVKFLNDLPLRALKIAPQKLQVSLPLKREIDFWITACAESI